MSVSLKAFIVVFRADFTFITLGLFKHQTAWKVLMHSLTAE